MFGLGVRIALFVACWLGGGLVVVGLIAGAWLLVPAGAVLAWGAWRAVNRLPA